MHTSAPVGRISLGLITVSLACVALASCAGPPRQTGNPDPGHRLMDAIRPVLTVVPSTAQITRQEQVKHKWDSCDGITASYGWDPATVDVDFTTADTATRTAEHISAAMRKLGWVSDPSPSQGGVWTWHLVMPKGGPATAQLLTDNEDWSLQADVPAATHPVRGC